MGAAMDCGCPAEPPPKALTRRRYLGLSALSAAAVGGYLAGPGLWQWDHAQARIKRREIAQVDVEPGPVDAALVARLGSTTTSAQSAPLILTYHDISHIKSQYSVTPETFAAQMKMLHDGGWITLTADRLEAWHRGEPLPSRSVLITFDDGCTGVWRYAEPVLRRYNMHAAAFIITGFVGTHAPYYMTWDHITDLHAAGRWDILAHTHLGHVYVPADDNGGTGPYLTTPMYLADRRRVETATEFHGRVTNDLAECKRQLGLQGFAAPRFFAYPFSAHEADVVQQTVLSLYGGGGMLDDSKSIQVTSTEDVSRGLIRRMDITWDTSLEDFVRKLELASPLDPASADPLRDRDGWTNSDQKPTEALRIDGNRMIIDPGPSGQTSVQYSRVRTTMWNNYTVSADLEFADHGTTTGICVFVGNTRHEVVTSVNRGYYSISFGNSEQDVSFGDLPDAEAYHLDITVTPKLVFISIDGQMMPVVMPPELEGRAAAPRGVGGGIGLTSHRSPDAPLSVISNLAVRR
ncbi:MAG: hypothetical protein QOE61_2117 [Micromonosporaceae bacterium]|jgi:biofilm PGA synthesis lipoprotein PgaB|nr:hypothetical protein [Micromonosporaceae bacterium]MDT5148471.1 hypothetical protein [Mycobacterium sp.]